MYMSLKICVCLLIFLCCFLFFFFPWTEHEMLQCIQDYRGHCRLNNRVLILAKIAVLGFGENSDCIHSTQDSMLVVFAVVPLAKGTSKMWKLQTFRQHWAQMTFLAQNDVNNRKHIKEDAENIFPLYFISIGLFSTPDRPWLSALCTPVLRYQLVQAQTHTYIYRSAPHHQLWGAGRRQRC